MYTRKKSFHWKLSKLNRNRFLSTTKPIFLCNLLDEERAKEINIAKNLYNFPNTKCRYICANQLRHYAAYNYCCNLIVMSLDFLSYNMDVAFLLPNSLMRSSCSVFRSSNFKWPTARPNMYISAHGTKYTNTKGDFIPLLC